MIGCDVTSSTGSGFGTEGGSLLLEKCTLSNCARHGAALFGDLYGEDMGPAELVECQIASIKGNGVRVRDRAVATTRLESCVSSFYYVPVVVE